MLYDNRHTNACIIMRVICLEHINQKIVTFVNKTKKKHSFVYNTYVPADSLYYSPPHLRRAGNIGLRVVRPSSRPSVRPSVRDQPFLRDDLVDFLDFWYQHQAW